MPALPSFDLYQELELSSTASSAEITASYRRLALLHHPDKNGNSAAATAKFQRLQSAHETLKDNEARQQYDAQSYSSSRLSSATYSSSRSSSATHSNASVPSYWTYSSYSRDSSDSGEELDEDLFYAAFGFAFGKPTSSGRSFHFSFPSRDFFTRRPQTEQEREAASKKAREEEAAREKQHQQEYQERWNTEHARREASEAVKRKTQEEDQERKESKWRDERVLQEKVWEAQGENTREQKQKSCLHTDFWPKEQLKKKVKCDACTKKRVLTGFKCPHCDLLVCQVCLDKLNKKRAKEATP
ncbi:hypothetical protein EG329_002330 [Mollisiaceae sp. DMI_Dod_QoI]|nr:hypothetical protein EG329_002330 [Helotiales sp. DMI_Dod_QoI]